MRHMRLTSKSILAAPPQHRSRGWRRRSAAVLLAMVLAGVAGYWYLTRPARLIPIAVDFLQGMSGGEVTIGSMDFTFFGGINLTDVLIRTPKRFDFGPAAGRGRVAFAVADLHLQHDPLSLLLGRFVVKRITAVRPQFQIVHQKATGLSNWQAMLSARPAGKHSGQQQWPIIHLKHCMLRSGMVDGKTLTFADPIEMEVLAEPQAGKPGEYTCRLQPLGNDRIIRTMQVDVPNGRIRGDLPDIRLSQVLPSLPPQCARWCDILELTGQLGADNIEFDRNGGSHCTVNLAHVSLSVPEDESEFYGKQARARRLLRLNGVAGRITFDEGHVTFDLTGRMNGGPCHLWGSVEGCGGPMGEMGYQIHIDVPRVAFPDRSNPYVADQVRRLPPRIYKYFTQFDPTVGALGVQGCVTRPAGPDQKVQFRGVVTTKDAAGYYDDFPYHASHANATIRCTDKGIFFTVLAQRDPETMFRVSGWVDDGSPWSDADVYVQAVSIPLDAEMFRSLPPKFQRLLNNFDFYGLINCDFHLARYGGTPATGAAPWRWETKISLRDVAGRYRPFNYMQHGIRGTFEAANGIIHKIDLYAVDPLGTMTVQGRADLRDEQKSVDLRIHAYNQVLTPDLLPALPETARQVIHAAGVAGLFNVDARLNMSRQTHDQLQCRADIDWRDGRFAASFAPYPFDDVRGHLYVDLPNDRIDLRDIRGHNGPALLHLDGTIHTGAAGVGAFQCCPGRPAPDGRSLRRLAGVSPEVVADLQAGRLDRCTERGGSEKRSHVGRWS